MFDTYLFILLQKSQTEKDSIDNIKWTKEISMKEALYKIEVKFFPFKKVSCRVDFNSGKPSGKKFWYKMHVCSLF